MLKLVLLRFWPIWLPLIGYLLWLYFADRRARKLNISRPKFFGSQFAWVVIATLLILAAMFVWLAVSGTGRQVQPVSTVDVQPAPSDAIP